jgi:hypothetical protein
MTNNERPSTAGTQDVPDGADHPTQEDAQPADGEDRSGAFREALRKDDEREEQSNFNPDRGIFGQTGAGPDVAKTDPRLSQKKEETRARREEGYVDGES